MIVLVTGGRDFNDRELVFRVLDELKPSLIVHGGAKGADMLARFWARANGVRQRIHNANWERFGRAAGTIRNQAMLDEQAACGEPVALVVAFPGGKGTADMVRRARGAGIEVREVSMSICTGHSER